MTSKLEIARVVVNLIVGAGASKIASDIIKNNSNPVTVADKVTTIAGGLVLGSMVADAATTHVGAKMDDFVQKWNENKSRKSE